MTPNLLLAMLMLVAILLSLLSNAKPSYSSDQNVMSYLMFPFMRDIPPLSEVNTPSTIGTGSAKNLTIISGTWEPIPNGIQAGAPTLYTLHNILLQSEPVNATNLDISTSITVNRLPKNTASYISIVYSFEDRENFKYAGITFFNNKTYANFASVRDGTLSWDTAWPGSEIDLEWIPGDPIRMRLSLRDDSRVLSVNGIESLRQNIIADMKDGQIGLSYARVLDVVFNRFDAQIL